MLKSVSEFFFSFNSIKRYSYYAIKKVSSVIQVSAKASRKNEPWPRK